MAGAEVAERWQADRLAKAPEVASGFSGLEPLPGAVTTPRREQPAAAGSRSRPVPSPEPGQAPDAGAAAAAAALARRERMAEARTESDEDGVQVERPGAEHAAARVGLEGVKFGWPALPLPLEQFLRCGCVGQERDGAGGHPELAADRPPAEPGGQQFVDGRVVDAGAVGEAVSPRPGRAGGVLRLGARMGRIWRQDLQASAVICDAPLCSLSQVVPKMPPVRHLHCLRCPVDQDRPVVTAFAGRVLIDADYPRDWNFGVGQRFDQPEHRAAADGHAEDSRHAGTGPAGEREADRGRRRPQALGPSAVPTGQARHGGDAYRCESQMTSASHSD
ncbi:hypothetical protein [Streptomyces sp. NPDC056492]|uniref:hypothetical protein n=1 Tax=unclassified Streptomyces TaxID=2593676 RepID=UPI0036C404B5